ncbi:hypothetical protein [Salipiger abyssi]|uniref:hypothetical protein n=1 Tax=Salipiger abyssi TaxID=1250539 RepID=UPI001A8E25F0|nr:hypothetical protein [Salipiger abyssi]MBN9889810.1 hypothetical protein [Salipiger abyssi]
MADMRDESQLILHAGLPKGGSSALQTALSQSPDLVAASGRRLRYTVLQPAKTRPDLLSGEAVRLAAAAAVYGYVTWPSLGPAEGHAALFSALDGARRAGLDEDVLPVVSNESWVNHPEAFAGALAGWGHPPVDVVVYMRPPVDWVNAAYWQWGVWHAPNIGGWLTGGVPKYRFGALLEDWARIPNVRLCLGGFRPDVVAKFAARYDVALPGGSMSNSSSPPALIGFLLRNRRFRPSGHAPAAEFVFQRWCPPVPGRRLWAVRRKHLHDLRKTVRETREALERIAADADLADVLADPRWQEEAYLAEIEAGPSPLDDRAELAGLYASLCEGIARAQEAADAPMPALPSCPPGSAGLELWDAALTQLMEALLAADDAARKKNWRQAAKALVRTRGRGLLPRFLGGR